MSKDQLPTQKGTTLFPQVTKALTKVRFHGVPPGSQEAQQLVQRYAAQINHFHRAQAQKYALSTVENYRAHGTYPGLKMTYTNLQGQEIIDIRVETVLPQVEGQAKQETPPDFCVVDLVVENSINVYSEIYFKLVQPEPDVYPYEYSDGNFDPDWDYSNQAEFPLMEATVAWSATSNVDFADRIHSLMVDFRRLPKFGRVVVDLYGRATPDEYPIIGQEFAGWERVNEQLVTVGTFTVDYTAYGHLAGSPFGIHEIPENVNMSTDFGGVVSTFPDLWAAQMDAQWTVPPQYHDPSGLRVYEQSVGVSAILLAGPFPFAACPSHGTAQSRQELRGIAIVQEFSADVEPVYDDIYADTYDAPVYLQHAFYWPGTVMQVAQTSHKYDDSIWVSAAGVLPVRRRFGEGTITDSFADNEIGQPYLGRVTIERFPPSVRFDPA